MNILDYYKYAALATAAYVRMGSKSLDGATFADEASSLDQAKGRLPLSIATELFNPADPNASRWTIAHYFGGDIPGYNDDSGFAATLFKKDGENVLALRGVEANVTFGDTVRDLLGASVGGIGMLGVALNQVVDMVNLIQRLYGSGKVTQIRAELTLVRPDAPDAHFVELGGSLPTVPWLPGIPVPIYLSLTTYQAQGENVLAAGDKITLTGHSLGGHLAMVAAQLFGDRINPDVYAFNSAGFDPVSVDVVSLGASLAGVSGSVASALVTAAKGALVESMGAGALLLSGGSQQASARILGKIGSMLGSPGNFFTVHNLESEDSAPGDDVSVVASVFTDLSYLGPKQLVGTEVNSHSIEQIMDALALQSVFYRLDETLTLDKIKGLIDAAHNVAGKSEEALVEALHVLLVPGSRFSGYGLELPIADASEGSYIWTGKGKIEARDEFHKAILEINKRLDEIDHSDTRVLPLTFRPADSLAPGFEASVQYLKDKATDDSDAYAFRYALKELNPFAVTGVDYSAHNQDGRLELYDREYHTGSLTQKWIEDSATFLVWKSRAFLGDVKVVGDFGTEDQEFIHVPGQARIYTMDSQTMVDANGLPSGPPSDPRRFVFGGDKSDVLTGGKKDDRLYGGFGRDILQGGEQDDYLEGGAGLDIYQYGAVRTVSGDQGQVKNSNDGTDTIVDTDGRGILRYFADDSENRQTARVIMDARIKLSDTQWRSTDGRFTYTKIPNDVGQYNLRVDVTDEPGGSMVLRDWREGDFGIRLGSGRPTPPEPTPVDPPIKGDKHVPILTATVAANAQGELIGVPEAWSIVGQSNNLDQDDQIISATVTFYVVDALGNAVGTVPEPDRADTLYGSEDSDVIQGVGGNDEVHARSGDDLIFGGTGHDSLYGDAGSDKIFGEAGQDHLFGGLNDDELFGGDDADILNGMDGKDRLAGGTGKDLLFGDEGDDEIYVGEMIEPADLAQKVKNAETQSATGEKGEWLDGGEGDDIALGGSDNDQLMGGGGNDVLIGGGGNDNLNGDLYGVSVDRDNWLVTREVEPTGSFTLYRERYNEYIQYGVSQPGGHDILYGGAGSDWLFGWGGNDLLDGGNDDDVAFGGTGDDVLLGGAGSDVLTGDNGENSENPGADYLDGGDGADFLWGNGGDDILLGGSGNDELYGGAGDDLLIGGGGEDRLDGGAGRDTYVFNKGDDKKVFYDTPPEDPQNISERSILVLGDDIKREDIKFRLGSLMIDLGGGDEIHFMGFNPDDPYSTVVLGEIRFSDGTSMTYQDVLDQGFDINGTEGDDNGQQVSSPMLVGTAVADRIRGLGGNDVLAGLAGDDTLDGGAGADFLQGGAGNDRYVADLTDTIDDINGHNSIVLSSDVTPGELVAQHVTIQGVRFLVVSKVDAPETAPGLPEGLRIIGDVLQQNFDFTFADGATLTQHELYNVAFTESVTIEGANGDDVLAGYGGDDTVRGRSGSDTIIGARGDDLLIGDNGSDTYLFDAGDGHDTIDERGMIAIGYADTTGTDVVRFADGIAAEDLVLLRQANGDLIVSYNADDQITVKGQYNTVGNAIERIEFADGTVIDTAQLAAVQVAAIEGTEGADVLTGTTAAETVLGLGGDDVIDGGTGNDRLQGGSGADTYLIYAGMGMDTLIDPSGTTGEIGTLKLTSGYSLASITTQRTGDDLTITLRGTSDGVLIKNYYNTTVPAQHWQLQTTDAITTDIEDVIGQPDPFVGEVALAAREAYRQSLLAAWSTISKDSLPTHADVFSSWAQTTVTNYGADPNQPPQIAVLNPVTYTSINGYGVAQGGTITPSYPSARTIQTQFLSRESDDAVIGVIGSASTSSSQESHTVTFLGTPQSNRNISSTSFAVSATTVNGIVLSTSTGWVPIALDQSGANDGAFQFSRITENCVIEEINAGESNNLISGVIGGNGSHIALIDAGGGDDTVQAGIYDFVYGGDGFDSVYGGRLVYGGNGNDFLSGGTNLYGGAGDDSLQGGVFMAGGAGDDILSGQAGATTFYIDPTKAGQDRIEDTGGSRLAFEDWYYHKLGIPTPNENREFGGMWGVIGDTGVLVERYYQDLSHFEFRLSALGRRDRFYSDYDVGDHGYPSDVTSTVYASLEDLRAEFAAMGITYKAQDIRYIPPLPAIPQVFANEYAALQPLYDAGIIEQDVVAFGPGLSLSDLTVLREQVADGVGVRDNALVLSWSGGHAMRVALAQLDDSIGTGIERYRFADGTSISTRDMLALAMPVVLHQGPDDFTFLPGSGIQTLEAHFTHIFFDATIAADDISISRSDLDLVISRDDSDDRLYILNWYADPNAIPAVSAQFYNGGSILYADDLTSAGLVVHGTAADDTLYGLNGFPNRLFGEAGSDVLIGEDGNDVLDGGAGDDALGGGAGSDTYMFGQGSGHDTIRDVDDQPGTVDTVSFAADVLRTDVAVYRAGANMLLTVNGSGNTLTVQDQFADFAKIEQFVFGDGTVWDAATAEALAVTEITGTADNDVLTGTSGKDRIDGLDGNDTLIGLEGNDRLNGGLGDDSLFGQEGDDILNGGLGDDLLIGGADADIYIYTANGGLDTIDDFAESGRGNELWFAGVGSPESLTLLTDGDFLIAALDRQAVVRVSGFNAADVYGSNIIQTFRFDDGSVLSYQDLVARGFDFFAAEGGGGPFTGTNARDRFHGSEAFDSFSGSAGDDVLYGLGGVDVLCGDDGDDYLDGGAGNDTLAGGEGNDIYRVDRSSGHDRILEAMQGAEDFDTLIFGGAIRPQELIVTREGSQLTIAIAGANASIEFAGWYGSIPQRVENFVFDETTSTSKDIDALINDPPIVAVPLPDQQTDEDRPWTYQIAQSTFVDNDPYDSLSFTAARLDGTALPEWVSFNADTRKFSGTPANEDVGTISLRVTATDAGGLSVTDAFSLTVVNVNDAPIVIADAPPDFARDGEPYRLNASFSFNDVDRGDSLTFAGSLDDKFALPGWLTVDSATGILSGTPGGSDVGTIAIKVTATDIGALSASAFFEVLVHPHSDLVLTGTGGADTLAGQSGNDTLNGLGGTDTMIGGYGNDTYFADNAGDLVTEFATQGDDTVFSSISYTLTANVENLTLTGSGKIIGTGNALANRLIGNSNANTLIGGTGDDTLDGGAGGDAMIGGIGNDRYVVDNSADKITENANGGVDSVRSAINFTLGANLENLILIGASAISGAGNALDNLLVGNPAANSLTGGSGKDILQGLGGNDILRNGAGNTLFDGGAGADAMTGGGGRELFVGGSGNDVITTGKAADIIAFNAGDSQDVVNPNSTADNTLSLGGGIGYQNLRFSKSYKDLVLGLGGTDQVTFKNWYAAGGNRSVAKLQVITEAMSGYNPVGTDTLLDNKVEQFNFTALANAFDAAGQVNGWALTNALLSAHLSGSDTAAIGGDLAYQYGKNGTLSGIGLTPAQDVLNASQFGSGAQTLRPIQDLQQGQIRLS